MKKLHILGIGILAIPFVILSVYGASKGYEELNLIRVENDFNHKNSAVFEKKEEVKTAIQNAQDAFCFLVKTKKEYDRVISSESLGRFDKECLGLQ